MIGTEDCSTERVNIVPFIRCFFFKHGRLYELFQPVLLTKKVVVVRAVTGIGIRCCFSLRKIGLKKRTLPSFLSCGLIFSGIFFTVPSCVQAVDFSKSPGGKDPSCREEH